jgi:Dyp-type peroxidase family
MAINLDKPAQQVKLDTTEYDALRANLQANILKGTGRDHQRLVVLQFTGTAAAVKAWIKAQIMVTTAEDQRVQHANLPADGGLITGFFISASGYKKLGYAVAGFASKAFRKGMKAEGSDEKDPKPATWEAPYQGDVDALVSFCDDSEAKVKAAVTALVATFGTAVKKLTVEEGRKLKTADTLVREHFGYVDGISNPIFEKGGTTSSRVDPEWDDGAPLRLALTLDPFAQTTLDAMGSYFVFRKLGQDVGAFDNRVVQLATSLGTNPDLAGAMAVGRFKDGTPVIDSPTPAGQHKENGFDYEPDSEKFKCPAHAHIRKTNPRGTTPLTSLADERKRRIVRRGMPYGKPVFPITDPAFHDPSLTAKRGLLFMCYQRNIEKQFAFIQRTWADSGSFPTLLGQVGDDPVIGQDINETQKWPRVWGDKTAGRKDFNFEAAVRLEGGEYFFAPSKVFLATMP